jgi:5-methylcytosine-specific restriction endonuclease McrA
MLHTLVLNLDWTPVSVHPISDLSWKEAIPKIFEGRVSVIHEYENWTVRSPSRSIAVPSVVLITEYVNVHRFTAYGPEIVKLRDDYTCQYCLKRFPENELTVDHVIPLSHGGPSTVDNLVAACSPCNNRRGTDTRIQPHRQPWRPSRHEVIAMKRKRPISIPHVSWIQYIGWPQDLVRIQQPVNEPGYRRVDDPFTLSTDVITKAVM